MPQAIEPKPEDWWGYPSLETGYDVEALQDAWAFITVALQVKRYSWETPRVKAFVAEVERRSGGKSVVGCRLPAKAIFLLAVKLAQHLQEEPPEGNSRNAGYARAIAAQVEQVSTEEAKRLGAAEP
jgi:hypothetical protein